MTTKQLPKSTSVLSYKNQLLVLGSVIRNIESNWNGRIVAFEQHGDDVMLRCQHENNGIPEDDDTQWHSPADVVRVDRRLEGDSLWNALKHYPDAWIETTEAMNWEQLCCMPPRAGGNGYFLVGEPARHNEDGEAVYACFWTRAGRYYAKYLTVKQFKTAR